MLCTTLLCTCRVLVLNVRCSHPQPCPHICFPLFSFSHTCTGIVTNSCAPSFVFLSPHVLRHVPPSLTLTPRLVLSNSAPCSLLLLAAQALTGDKADGGDIVTNSGQAFSLVCHWGVPEDECKNVLVVRTGPGRGSPGVWDAVKRGGAGRLH